ncbi:NrdH-redoxin [Candidatus Saccharibacteria bacterium]|nr:NrdH-redoxin [Candidatus Saccharibacteria bacterium]
MSDTKSITVYTATWCGYCHAVKKYLEEKGVAFTDKDIDSDPSFAEEAVKKSGQMGIPVVDIDGKIIVGFDRMKINEALGISNF